MDKQGKPTTNPTGPASPPRKEPEKHMNLSIDYDDLERRDLLSGEPRYLEDELRNATFAMIFGALAAVFLIISLVMAWVLYSRERTRTFLWHAIILIFALLSAGLCAAWGAMSLSSIKVGRPPQTFLTGLVFVVAMIFAVYLFVESIWLVLYRPIHFNYLLGLFSDNETWNKRMIRDSNFDQGWKTDRRMMWWVVFFNIAAGLCFSFCAYATRSVAISRFNLTKLALYVALVWATFSCFMVVYWVEESYEYQDAFPTVVTRPQLYLLKVIAICTIVLVALNAVINLLQNRFGFFVISALELIALLIFICVACQILRQVRQYAFTEQSVKQGCIPTMISVHENDIERWCISGGKYLPAGTSCTKSYMVSRWEGSSEPRALNPSCCGMAKFFYLYPFMLAGYWSLYVIACLGIAIACNIYLADSNEYLNYSHASKGIVDYIGVALVFLIILGWSIYFLARKPNKLTNPTNSNMNSFIDPINNRIDAYTAVPPTIITNAQKAAAANPDGDGCYAYDPSTHPVPSFSTDNTKTTCITVNDCVERVSLLINGGKLKTGSFSTGQGPNQGTVLGRQNFFDGCTNSNSDYSLYYGTKDQIVNFFAQARICPNDDASTVKPTVKLFQDQQKKTDVQTTGLLTTEAFSNPVLGNFDQATCGTGYSTVPAGAVMSSVCSGNCKVKFDSTSDMTLYNLKGKLFYTTTSTNTDINPEVVVSAYKGSRKIGGAYTLVTGGIFSINDIPKYKGTTYTLTLKATDSTGRFQDKVVDIVVPKDTGSDTEIPAGSIRLTTKDGSVCAAGNTTCINAQALSFGQIAVTTMDSTNATVGMPSVPASAMKVQALRGHSISGVPSGLTTTGADGNGAITNLAYGSYMLIANNTGYRPELLPVDLQEKNMVVRPFVLKPTNDANDMRVSAFFNDKDVDFDLYLTMKSDKEATCTVSPTNKYCPYTGDVNDIAFGTGEESILVKQLSVSNYMAYISPAAAYGTSCANSDVYETNYQNYHSQKSWNWDSIKSGKPLNSIDISGMSFAKGAQVFDSNTPLMFLLTSPKFVETDEQAAVAKEVVSFNGVKPATNISISTAFRPYTQAGDDLGIFGWPNIEGDWKNTTIADTNINSSVTGGISQVINKTIQSVSTKPRNLTTQFYNISNTTTWTNGSKTIQNELVTVTATLGNTTYTKRAEEGSTLIGANNTQENLTMTAVQLETKYTNKTLYTVSQATVKIVRPSTNTTGNETSTLKISNLTFDGSKDRITITELISNFNGTNSAIDVRNEGAYIVETVSGSTSKTDHTATKSREIVEVNSTKRYETVMLNTVTTTFPNSTVQDATTVTTTVVYNLGRADQATKKSTTVSITQTDSGVTKNIFNSNSGFVPARRLLTEAHSAVTADANHILVSCFSGYGDPSLINLNQMSTAQPDISTCANLISKQKPNFTVQKLRSAVDEYLNNNPQYKGMY